MKDSHERTIDYMRISITDRCNLRCKYCTPEDLPSISHDEIMRFEDILTIARLAGRLGICKFKVTGGEPFVRKGCLSFLKALKELAAQINGKEVSVAIKVGENGKTFGSVTTAQVAAALFELGYEIDKKKIILKDAIKTLGAFSAEIKLTEGVSAKITVSVVPA